MPPAHDPDETPLVAPAPLAPPLAIDPRAAAAADAASVATVFDDYRSRLDPDTLRRQEADLALFAFFLGQVEAIPPAQAPAFGARLAYDPHAWANVTHGLVGAFIRWQLQEATPSARSMCVWPLCAATAPWPMPPGRSPPMPWR